MPLPSLRKYRFSVVALSLTALVGCGGGNHDDDVITPTVTIVQNQLAAADFNGDGRLDLAVSATVVSGPGAQPGEVELFFQDPVRPGVFVSGSIHEVGNEPWKLATQDLNGDGAVDIVVANNDSISVLLNNPARRGDFFPAVDYPAGPTPIAVAIGDLNGDLLPDVAVATGASGNGGIDLLIQNPVQRGTFLAPVRFSFGGDATSVAIGDLNGDGVVDIAATAADGVHVFFQDPATKGTFFTPLLLTAGLRPEAITLADLDRDGLVDIAVANAGSATDGRNSTVSIILQDRRFQDAFLPARNFVAPEGTKDLTASDLNGDGRVDIAVASVVLNSTAAGVVGIMFQDGNGNFALSALYNDGFTPQSLISGDLNNDGRVDLAVQDGPGIFLQDPRLPGVFLPEIVAGP